MKGAGRQNNLGHSAAEELTTAEEGASVDADFYRDEIRVGYRSPYFAELAEYVASGNLDPPDRKSVV